jgi:hypothetical protein
VDVDGVPAEAGRKPSEEAARPPSVADSNPVKAIEDALRTFPADEVILVTLPDEDAAWLERGSAKTALNRFSLPVTHLVVENY